VSPAPSIDRHPLRSRPAPRWAALLAALSALGLASGAARADEKSECASAAEDAQALRQHGKLRAAHDRLLVCAQASCPAVVRTDCTGWLRETDAALPTVVVHALDQRGMDVVGVRVFVDGVLLADGLRGTALAVDPGPHRFVYQASGSGEVASAEVLVAQGEKGRNLSVRFAVALEPDGSRSAATVGPPPPGEGGSHAPVAAYVVGAAGLAALGVFASFDAVGYSDYQGLHNGCGQTHDCAPSDVDAVRTKLIVAGISLGTGVAALAAATWLFLDRPGATARAGVTGLDLRVSPEGGFVGIGGRF
jgi:hypothetical protein